LGRWPWIVFNLLLYDKRGQQGLSATNGVLCILVKPLEEAAWLHKFLCYRSFLQERKISFEENLLARGTVGICVWSVQPSVSKARISTAAARFISSFVKGLTTQLIIVVTSSALLSSLIVVVSETLS